MWGIDIITVCTCGMSLVCLLAGCLFLVQNLTLWRTKYTLELKEAAHLAFPEEHDRIVEEIEELNSLRRRNKYLYIVFFTLSLVEYVYYIYHTDGVVPFDLLAFCISTVLAVSVTIVLTWIGNTTRFKLLHCSYYLEYLFGAILALLWIATLFFFFYLFPWLGCTIAVLFIVLGIVVIRVMIKYERSQNVKK